jgi:hypothetical protein
MTRTEQRASNHAAIAYLLEAIPAGRLPSRRELAGLLNQQGYRTSRGNDWTCHRLSRMLQRMGIAQGVTELQRRKRAYLPNIKRAF